MRNRFIVECNWKMHKTLVEAVEYIRELTRAGPRLADAVELVVCVPFTLLAAVSGEALPVPYISPGAQDCHWLEQGPFTGEISAPMLAEAGARYCFVGHSERRRDFNETDEMVNIKAKAVLKAGISPIICTGEDLTARLRGLTRNALERQLAICLESFAPGELERSVILYEPVWAIGTGENAAADQADEAHRFIRQWLIEHFPSESAHAARLIYGGSVNPDNARELLEISDIDGVGIGKACLDVQGYLRIAEICSEHVLRRR